MINLKIETIIPLTEAPKHYPGRRPHKATPIRHALHGVNGVVLESLMIGGRRHTSLEAIQRFIDALNSPQPPPEGIRPPTREAIDQQLDAAGF